MFSEGGNEGWERFRKRQGKTLRKILSKARKLEKNKSKQVKRFGNVEVEEGMGAAYMPKAGTQGVPEREVTSKAVKKQLNRNRNRAQMKGNLETPSIRYTHSRDKSTDYIRPVKKKRIHKKKVKEAVDKNDTKGLKKLVKGLKGSSKAHLGQAKELDKMISDEYIPEGSKPNNPKLWAAKKAAAKAKFDVYPSAYANGWAAKQYKAAGGTWRSEAVEYPADAHKDLKKLHDKEKNTWWKHQDSKTKSAQAAHQKRMIDGARKSISQYNKEGTYDNYSKMRTDFVKRRGEQLTPKEKERANALHKQRARDDIKRKMAKAYGVRGESFGSRGLSLQELGDPNKMTQLFRMGLAKKGELNLMQRMMKRGPDALKDPKLRQKMYDLLVDLTDIVTKDGQTFVKVRQHVQKNKKELQAVEELLHYGGRDMLIVNESYRLINIPEDMSGMSVSSGHKRSKDAGAGMTQKGVNAYRRRNPGSKLKTAVTTPPSKLKAGSKAAKRRKAFCSRSRSWTGERGKAARKRWNC